MLNPSVGATTYKGLCRHRGNVYDSKPPVSTPPTRSQTQIIPPGNTSNHSHFPPRLNNPHKTNPQPNPHHEVLPHHPTTPHSARCCSPSLRPRRPRLQLQEIPRRLIRLRRHDVSERRTARAGPQLDEAGMQLQEIPGRRVYLWRHDVSVSKTRGGGELGMPDQDGPGWAGCGGLGMFSEAGSKVLLELRVRLSARGPGQRTSRCQQHRCSRKRNLHI